MGRQAYREPITHEDAYRFVHYFKPHWDTWQARVPRPGYSWELRRNLKLANYYGTLYLVGHRHLVNATYKQVAQAERHTV